MKPIFLSIENFLCYDKTELELSNMSSALIIGQGNSNSDISNGVGKSTLFRAIEYALFNEARDMNLEELIRDDTNACKIIFDFMLGNKIWRISRSRTRKGTADLSLFERTEYEEDGVNAHTLPATDSKFKLFWEDKSSRRTPDTEADLEKLIKTNYKAFSSAFYFAQNDFNSGLANLTASKRRAFFRESLPIGIYSKLEKLAKDKAAILIKELDKKKAIRDNFGDLDELTQKLTLSLETTKLKLAPQELQIQQQEFTLEKEKEDLAVLVNQLSVLQAQNASILEKEKVARERKARLELAVADTTQKRKSVVAAAKGLTDELKALKDKEKTLAVAVSQFANVETLKKQADELRAKISDNNAMIAHLTPIIAELEIPLPNDAVCKHCRQPLTDTHRRTCEDLIKQELEEKKKTLRAANVSNIESNQQLTKLVAEIQQQDKTKGNLESIVNLISSKEKEIKDKKALFDDYSKMLEKQSEELKLAIQEYEDAVLAVQSSSIEEQKKLESNIVKQRDTIQTVDKILKQFILERDKIKNDISIIENDLKKNEETKIKKSKIIEEISEIEDEYSIFPDITQAFSPTGIPNWIVQGLLDDYQVEINEILTQIKPSLQMEFSVVKENDKGEETDDLNIKYFYNNKSRSFGAISGAMRLSVIFALKLGYANLLHKKLGTDINFLMLDEVDMPLDFASIDALADIIKHFHNDFTIFIVTHNARSRENLEKFSSIILVEQDQNMVSRAKVI